MKPSEHFGRCKRDPRPAPWEIDPTKWPSELFITRPIPAPQPRYAARLRSFGGWLMGSRFGFLRSLGGRLLRTGAIF